MQNDHMFRKMVQRRIFCIGANTRRGRDCVMRLGTDVGEKWYVHAIAPERFGRHRGRKAPGRPGAAARAPAWPGRPPSRSWTRSATVRYRKMSAPVRFPPSARRTSDASCPATMELPPTWKKSSSSDTVRASAPSVSAHASATAQERREARAAAGAPSAASTASAAPARRTSRRPWGCGPRQSTSLGSRKPEGTARERHHLGGVAAAHRRRRRSRCCPSCPPTAAVSSTRGLGQRRRDAVRRLLPRRDPAPAPACSARGPPRTSRRARTWNVAISARSRSSRSGSTAAHLPVSRAGNLIHQHQALRPLAGRQAVRGVLAELAQARALDPARGDDHDADGFLQRRVRHTRWPRRPRLGPRVALERLLDLRGGDDLAAAVDHFFAPPGDVQVPVRVHPPHVPGLEPPPGEERARRRDGSFSYPRVTISPARRCAPPTVAHALPASSTMATSGQMGCRGRTRAFERVPGGRARDRHASRSCRTRSRPPPRGRRFEAESPPRVQGPAALATNQHRRPRRPVHRHRLRGVHDQQVHRGGAVVPRTRLLHRDGPEIAHVEEGHRRRGPAREERGQRGCDRSRRRETGA